MLPFTDIVWMINDSERSIVALWVSGTIHLFRMALFMLLAGYFGRMVTLRRGSGSYFRDRAKRILLPAMILGTFIITFVFTLLGSMCCWLFLKEKLILIFQHRMCM